jgi:hypothetical protein
VIVVSAGAACCIMERPAKEHFLRSRSRSSLVPLVGKKSGQRALNVYSAGAAPFAAPFAAPNYSAAVGDALRGFL